MSSDNTKKSHDEIWNDLKQIMSPDGKIAKAWRAVAEADIAWMNAEMEHMEADMAWMKADRERMNADMAWMRADIALRKADVERMETEVIWHKAKLALVEAEKKAQVARESKLAAETAYRTIHI